MSIETDRLKEKKGTKPILTIKWAVTIHTMKFYGEGDGRGHGVGDGDSRVNRP